jgi:PII-like signaling protein
MADVFLKIYVGESQRHHGVLLYEWLLQQARNMGIPGGSAFRALAGYGRHGVLHEEAFFELAGNVPVEVGFLASETDVQRLLDLITQENLRLFYAKLPAEHGTTG